MIEREGRKLLSPPLAVASMPWVFTETRIPASDTISEVHMKIHFMGSAKPTAQRTVQQLIEIYGQSDLAEAAYVVAIGGDGTTLKALSSVPATVGTPVFAMRLPESVGALGNVLSVTDLPGRLKSARRVLVRPLKAEIERVTGEATAAFGFNEIVVTRQRLQSARLNVRVGEAGLLRKLTGDGLLLATPIGSAGYNRSAGGSILPPDSGLMTLTGIAVHVPSDWTNTILSDGVTVDIEVVDPVNRPVRVETSFREVTETSRIKISSSPDQALLLFG